MESPFLGRSRRGAAIVEAAMVYPFVILVVTGLLTVSIQLYADTRIQALEHLESRDTGESIALNQGELVRRLDLLDSWMDSYEN